MKHHPPCPALFLALLACVAAPSARADEPGPGALLYQNRCANCHGARGEGTPDDYPKPLVGDKTPAQLAKLIGKTMPADDPGTLKAEEAEQVAAFIHEAFYSPAAQARNAPARVELSRLTVRQYRQAMADLFATFRGTGKWGKERGLKAQYFKSRRRRNNERVIERIDPEVRFDFGTSSPDAENIPDAHEFTIQWEGSVLAPETGDYEFVVRTDHATRLWINDPREPLIDALVKSGDDVEHKASIFLIGGRVYNLRLEFIKAKQGVNDSDKNKERPVPPAMIALEWTVPGGVREVIPARALSPEGAPLVYIAANPFPADDRSVGYERGTSVSKAWDEATTEGAIHAAAYVVERARDLTGAKDDDADRADKYRNFGRRFAERAFRRPLSDELARLYVDRQFVGVSDPAIALKRVVLLVLKSPRFLYREVASPGLDGFDVASRLSFGLWDSLPDQELLDAAASGRLMDREEVTRQASRMVGDLRSRAKLREFLHQWLKMDRITDLGKDRELFPEFGPEIVGDLRTSLDLFLDDVAWGEGSDFRRLLLDNEVFLNERLARFYGVELPVGDGFRKVKLDPDARAGVLTHPFLLAGFAYTATSSPIHRGVFVARSVLGRTLRPPPNAFAPLAPDLHPDLNTRERTALQTRPETCMSCHAMINPLGFTLEQFDAVGRFRAEEKGRPIDATGHYVDRAGETVDFDGARALASYLAGSDEVHEAFAEQLFHYLVKQPAQAFGPRTLADLRRSFAEHGFSIQNLMVDIVATTSLAPRQPERQADAGNPAGRGLTGVAE